LFNLTFTCYEEASRARPVACIGWTSRAHGVAARTSLATQHLDDV